MPLKTINYSDIKDAGAKYDAAPSCSVVFGFVDQLNHPLIHKLKNEGAGWRLKLIDPGSGGLLFYDTTYGEIVTTEDAVQIKLGLTTIEGHGKAPSSGLLVLLDKHRPDINIYQSLVPTCHIYYARQKGAVIFSDTPKTLNYFLEKSEVEEKALPMHFLFRLIPGNLTYFKGVWQMRPGEWLNLANGVLNSRIVTDLRSSSQIFSHSTTKPEELLLECLKETLRGYGNVISKQGKKFGTLLSGGVDSSLIQLGVNECLSREFSNCTFSYMVSVDSFKEEIEYARQAAHLLKTQHTAVSVCPESYPGLLEKTVEIAGYPSLCVETAPCTLALAEYLKTSGHGLDYFMVGHGADALYGFPFTHRLRLLNASRKIPLMGPILSLYASMIAAGNPRRARHIRQVVSMLAASRERTPYHLPENMINVYTDLEMTRRSFGDKATLAAMEERQGFIAQYIDSATNIEQAQTNELLTWDMEAAVFDHRLFLSQGFQLLFPFMDEQMVQLAYSFHPGIRYTCRGKLKYILKRALEASSLGAVANNPKKGGTFEVDLFEWMKNGSLRDRVQAINRPSFLGRNDFEQLKQKPSTFLWQLLTYDIFLRRVINQ